ncbi:MAG: hypothetical protein HZC26_02130 [Candidatus Magasanikbacteria bacterium]|nr:hypothetical protein [Candidatus Magasanikbacteria bacterium]
MSGKTLSNQALQIIKNYLLLPFSEKKISCPYFNNKRSRVRGALGVLIGKGTPEEIADEAGLIALREKVDLKNLNDEQTKKILVEHNLGVDCSGLIYHVLNAELNARKLGPLRKHIKRPWIKSPIRKLIALLRPAENTGVNTFFNDINTKEIKLSEIQPGDLIIMMNTGSNHSLHHILLINKVGEAVLRYTHSFQFPDDGLYNHGVRQEEIKIIDPNKNLLEQNWSEPRMREYAKTAMGIKIKRLKIL